MLVGEGSSRALKNDSASSPSCIFIRWTNSCGSVSIRSMAKVKHKFEAKAKANAEANAEK